MYFKRKVYDKLIEWKENYANEYAALLEGADVIIGLNQEKLSK